ncbi:unnamed protein product [Schistosoma curassoni]|uniref:Uncharacterized protein n=1 Tax=Schistosoma curassoni TaxID=6186 RepID=A0A183L512_9TREM|nr:unnamed protein product [Schistosoma curassoni]
MIADWRIDCQTSKAGPFTVEVCCFICLKVEFLFNREEEIVELDVNKSTSFEVPNSKVFISSLSDRIVKGSGLRHEW